MVRDKVEEVKWKGLGVNATLSPHSFSPPANPPDFSVFTHASESEIRKILSDCPNKQSNSDPITTWLLKRYSSVIVSTITDIVNLSHFWPVSSHSQSVI